MSVDLKGRSFLKELDFTPEEWRYLLDLSAELKAAKKEGREVHHLAKKNIALIFEKTSTRTRCSFEVAAFDQGAHVTYLDPTGSQMGHKESVRDTARVLGRYYDGLEFRGKRQTDVETLAADLPPDVNRSSDRFCLLSINLPIEPPAYDRTRDPFGREPRSAREFRP